MKRFKWMSLLLVLILLMVGCSQEDEPTEQGADDILDNDVIISMAEKFINQLNDGEYEKARENFDATMSAEVDVDGLKGIWESIEAELGDFIAQEYDSTEEIDGYRVVFINGTFNDSDIKFQVTFNEDNEIAGFFLV